MAHSRIDTKRFRVKPGKRFSLAGADPCDTAPFEARDGAAKSLAKHVHRLFELKHDFMWRCLNNLPERGRIGIFNRSYYQDVLVSRVHPQMLEQRQLPSRFVTPNIWRERFEDIRDIERYLTRNGTVIRKIFLNVSKAEQRRRFLMRLHNPEKRWKFSINDVNERLKWKQYMAAYDETMAATSTADAPWYVVPADRRCRTRVRAR